MRNNDGSEAPIIAERAIVFRPGVSYDGMTHRNIFMGRPPYLTAQHVA